MGYRLMNDDMTIAEAKQILRDEWEQGLKCPCCTQFVKLYKRKIYSTPARGLIELYRLHQKNPQQAYFHISDIESMRKSGGGDFAKLMYWGLVAEKENE